MNRIKQFIPLPLGEKRYFQEAAENGDYNITWQIIGAVLTEEGGICALAWDGKFCFKGFSAKTKGATFFAKKEE